MPLSPKEEMVKAAYEAGDLPAITTDYDTYIQAISEGNPDNMRMRTPLAEPPPKPLFSGLRETFIGALSRIGVLPKITASYEEYEHAVNTHNPHHVRMKAPAINGPIPPL